MKKRVCLIYVILIIIFCVGLTSRPLQNDVFYMIRLGKDIFKYGIDMKDHYSWISNLSYTYPHWLYDIYLYLIYKHFNFFGIYINTIFVYSIFSIIFFLVVLKSTKNYFYSFFVTFISIFGIFMFESGRSLLLTGLLFFLEVYFINKLIDSGKNRYVFFLIINSLLIANIHATVWLFYFVLFLPFMGEKIVYFLVKKYELKYSYKLIIKDIKYFNKLLISLVGSFLMGLFTPSRICYTYIIRIMMGDTQLYISEHFPLIVIKHPLFIILVLLLVLVLIFSKTRIKLQELFMIGGLILMSLMSLRHLVFFYTIGLLYMALIVFRYFEDKRDKTFYILDKLVINNKVVLFCLVIFVSFISYGIFDYNSNEDYVSKKEYPVGAVKYIKNNLDIDDLKIYNDYNVGSYLLFNDIPVFIDSRCDLYLKEFNKDDIFDEFINIEKRYKKVFKKYKINYVLVNNRDIFNEIMRNDVGYERIYFDKNFSLYDRK